MPTWKRIFLKAAGFGAGAIVALALIVACVIWYSSRPTPPKPWNRSAISAEYYRTGTAEDDRDLKFEYVLENNTERDYELQTYSKPKIAARLEDTNSLTGFADEGTIALKLPIFVPAHQKTRITVILTGYGFTPSKKMTDVSTDDERQKYRAEIASHVAKAIPNLNGFVVFDESNRCQIELPGGWKQVQTERKLTSTPAKQ